MHLENTDWAQVFGGNDVDYASEHFTEYVLKLAKKFIPIREYAFPKSSHPWLNEKCLELVLNKHNAEGKEDYELQRDLCSKGLSTEFKCHAERMKAKISGLPVSSKKWWKLCNTLLVKKSASTSIPPLRSSDGTWALTAVDKAELLSSAFQSKFSLVPNPDGNDQVTAEGADDFEQGFLLIRVRWTRRILNQLDESSATGPDGLPSMVLKYCSKELAFPVTKLLRMMLGQGRWPKIMENTLDATVT